jgi:excisionase family DNA binding protein
MDRQSRKEPRVTQIVNEAKKSGSQLSGREGLNVGRLARGLENVLPSVDVDAKVELVVNGERLDAVIPKSVIVAMSELLRDISEGREVTVAPADLKVSTETIAAILGVSRPWAAELIDRGEIAGERPGANRRAQLGDVIRFRREDDERRTPTDWSFLDETGS